MKTIFFVLLFIPSFVQCQSQQQDLLIYNIGLGGISSGIGAVINKPKNCNWKKVFLKGLWQGSVGGVLNYSSKKTLYLINRKNELMYAWPAKILHAAGLSIMENASLNEPFLQNWNIDYGPMRFDFSINGKKKCKVRFLPATIVSVIYAANTAKFDLKKTLKTGNLIFENSENAYVTYRNGYFRGFSAGRAIAIGEKWKGSNQVIAHEIVHQFQYGDFQILNTWLKPFEKKIKSKPLYKIFENYIYFDMPYFGGLYKLAGKFSYPHYYKNFFEFEAQRFSTNMFVSR